MWSSRGRVRVSYLLVPSCVLRCSRFCRPLPNSDFRAKSKSNLYIYLSLSVSLQIICRAGVGGRFNEQEVIVVRFPLEMMKWSGVVRAPPPKVWSAFASPNACSYYGVGASHWQFTCPGCCEWRLGSRPPDPDNNLQSRQKAVQLASYSWLRFRIWTCSACISEVYARLNIGKHHDIFAVVLRSISRKLLRRVPKELLPNSTFQFIYTTSLSFASPTSST